MPIFKKEGNDVQNGAGKVAPKKKNIPAGLWTKCPECEQIIYNKELQENRSVCQKCEHHFIVGARDRIVQLLDEGSFTEINGSLQSVDVLSFKGVKGYQEKLKEDQARTQLLDACITGEGKVDGVALAFGVTDSRFIMGSMGSVVGEKITRLIEFALEKQLPVVIVSGSGGGALECTKVP